MCGLGAGIPLLLGVVHDLDFLIKNLTRFKRVFLRGGIRRRIRAKVFPIDASEAMAWTCAFTIRLQEK